MPPDRQLLLLATAAFLAAVVPAARALLSGHWRPARQWIPMLIGFALQTGAVYLRGEAVRQCPMKSLSDVLVFIAWSVVLLYFLVGPTYHVSLLGIFTAPVVTLLHGLAFVVPNAFPDYSLKAKIDPYVEMHAALALIAYAAFALACITGVMYLLQERLLKRHRIHGLFYQLPPIQDLSKAIQKLVLLGLILLSASLAISFKLTTPISNPKLIFAWVVWALYAVIGIIMWRHVLSPRQTAWLASVGFIIPFISLWLVTSHG
ncbi:MAG: cytochrome c biogenesis protein CcsA [Verrucomicrobiota bacterium]